MTLDNNQPTTPLEALVADMRTLAKRSRKSGATGLANEIEASIEAALVSDAPKCDEASKLCKWWPGPPAGRCMIHPRGKLATPPTEPVCVAPNDTSPHDGETCGHPKQCHDEGAHDHKFQLTTGGEGK